MCVQGTLGPKDGLYGIAIGSTRGAPKRTTGKKPDDNPFRPIATLHNAHRITNPIWWSLRVIMKDNGKEEPFPL